MSSSRRTSSRTRSATRSSRSARAARAKAPASSHDFHALREFLLFGDLFFEKGALDKSAESFSSALKLARRLQDWPAVAEALTGLIRLANESLDNAAIDEWERELEELASAAGKDTPAMVWYCRGAISRHRGQMRRAQREFLVALKAVRVERRPSRSARLLSRDDEIARAWVMMGVAAFQGGHWLRAQYLTEALLTRYQSRQLKKINANLHLLSARLAETEGDIPRALAHFQKAHAEFLAEHNWYYHLHVLLGYSRLARAQRNYAQAYWYLDLVDKAASSPGFAAIRREVKGERARLVQDSVDLLIDSRRGTIKTRDGQSVSLRKQWVLLKLLEALSRAHGDGGDEDGRGLSKAEIIEAVWREPYRPEAHDNKLYYNINRLRKLLEPDMREPKYLLNWREGYRLAPGLRVQLVGGAGGSARPN
jgi:DNA-binding winged helix-turn-helix (wHTH) protein